MASKELPFSAVALYEYKSDFEDDLNFGSGQVIQITAIEDDEWYSGTYTDSDGVTHSGMFPKNFVNEVDATSNLKTSSSEPIAGQELQSLAVTDEKDVSSSTKADSLETPVNPVIPKEQADAEKLKEAVNHDSEEQSTEKPFAPKGLSSRISTFDSEKSFQYPGSKLPDEKSHTKSYKGASSSYMPPSLGNKDKDSKSSKPDFSHSSYVPPPLKKEKPQSANEKSIDHQPEPIKPSSSFREEPKEEDEGPKLSLKERIALLQQKQKEEAEREAEAHKKKQQKKESQKKSATAAPSTTTTNENETSAEKGAEEVERTTGESLTEPVEEEDEIAADLDEDFHPEVTTDRDVRDEELDETEEVAGGEGDENDEEEEDEDSEESRRAALRERMAKLAGAGMYGGFNPFAAAGGFPSKSSAPTKKKSKSVEEDNAPKAAPIPIMPFNDASGAPSLPEALQKRESTIDNDQETEAAEDEIETEVGEDKDISDPILSDTHSVRSHDNHSIKSHPRGAPEPPIREAPVGDDESFLSASESVGGEHSLSERLTQADIVPPSKNLNSESAVEGDDEEEKYSTEEDLTFSDREREKKEKTLKHISGPIIDSSEVHNIGSDYTTGYESDDDAQIPVQRDVPKIPPPPPASAPQAPSRPNDKIIKEGVPEVPRQAPPPPIPSVSIPSTEKRPKAPPPPIPSDVEPSNASIKSLDPGTPSAPTRAPVPPPPVPQTSDHQDFTPSKPARRTSSIHSSRSIRSHNDPPPIPQSPVEFTQSPQLPSGPPPVPGIKTSSASRDFPLSPESPTAPSPTVRRASTLPTAQESPQEIRGSVSSAVSRGETKLDVSSGWWLNKNELPPSLQSRVDKDLIFEVDQNVIKRRGGKQLVLKDYYILNQDNSQIVLHVVFDPVDPQGTVNITETTEQPPIPNKSQLDKYSTTLGNQVFQIASRLINQSLKEPLVPYVLSQIKGVLKPVGLRSYGAVIYTNSNNTEVHQIDDFKPGDIIAINKAKFQGHNKLHQKIIYDVGNNGAPFAGVITEFDSNKKKFRVIEVDSNGKVKHSSYKPSDMKSGKMKVFRVVSRDFVAWD